MKAFRSRDGRFVVRPNGDWEPNPDQLAAFETALGFIATGIEKEWFIRLTDYGEKVELDWHQVDCWWPGPPFLVESGRAVADVLLAIAGYQPDGVTSAPDRVWPEGHFEFDFGGAAWVMNVLYDALPIGKELIVFWDDGTARRVHSMPVKDQKRLWKLDRDAYYKVSSYMWLKGSFVEPHHDLYHQTIQSAVRNARVGTRIHITPGDYEEEIWITRSVQMMPRPAGVVRIVSKRDPCLRVTAENVLVHGLQFHLDPWPGAKPMHAVAITKGDARLQDCTAKSCSAASVAVIGTGVQADLRRCTISGGGEIGLSVFNGAECLATECQMNGNAKDGVRLRTGAKFTARGCQMQSNGRYGVHGDADVSGLVADCKLAGNQRGAFNLLKGHQVLGARNTT